MKSIIIAIIVVLALTCRLFADEINFAWDYDAGADVDGFNVYSGPMAYFEGEVTDTFNGWRPNFGSAPIGTVGKSARAATVDEPGWEKASKKFGFVVRAFRDGEESADSNVVYYTINNEPLQQPTNVTAQYDKANNIVSVSWDQPDADRAKFFRVYYRLQGQTDYTILGQVEHAAGVPLVLDNGIKFVPDGESVDAIFVVVAFKNESVFSPNSAEAMATIDRTIEEEIPVPQNFRISVEIKVE